MKKVAILIAVAFLVILIAPVMSYEIGNDVIYNVSTNKAQGEVIINMTIQAFSYDIDDTGHLIGSLHYIDNPTPSDIVISRDFNVVIVPSENCTIDNIYHTITTVSEPSYSYTESISVNPGTYLIVICNPGKNWREEGCVYEGMGGIGVNEFWNILQNAIINKTQSEILEMITEVTVGAYGSDDLIYVFDPLVEIKQPVLTSTPTIEPTPSSTSVPTSSPTPSPTPTVATTPTPTPTVTPTPQPIQTPKQPGFEAIVVIVSLLVTCLCLRRRN